MKEDITYTATFAANNPAIGSTYIAIHFSDGLIGQIDAKADGRYRPTRATFHILDKSIGYYDSMEEAVEVLHDFLARERDKEISE